MNINSISSKPSLSSAQIPAVIQVTAADESGGVRTVEITGEYPLTLYVDGREIVTLMTLGQMPEALSVGWLRNQRLVSSISDIEEVMVDWEVNSAAVYTRSGLVPLASKRTITSGCGQGTMFGDLLEEVQEVNFVRSHSLTATALAQLLEDIRNRDTVYKSAAAIESHL